MARAHRVHPVDMTPFDQPPHPPPYVMLGENDSQGGKQSQYRRNIPRYHSSGPGKKKSSKKCLRCICCCYCFLFLLVVILVGLVASLFYTFDPKVPTYKVQDMEVGAFQVFPDVSLYTKFFVYVKAENPNKKIGIIYDEGSSVKVEYKDSTLSAGELPVFYQGYENVTIMKVMLDGKSTFGSGLQEALMNNRNTGRIPLKIAVRVPVSIVLGTFPLKTVVVKVDISLVVDSLSPKKKVGILSTEYKIWVETKDPKFVFQVK